MEIRVSSPNPAGVIDSEKCDKKAKLYFVSLKKVKSQTIPLGKHSKGHIFLVRMMPIQNLVTSLHISRTNHPCYARSVFIFLYKPDLQPQLRD
jgi:hypothetical protein